MWYNNRRYYSCLCYKSLSYMMLLLLSYMRLLLLSCMRLIHNELFHTIFNILGDQCLDIYESNSGCCVQGCNVGSCYCDSDCYEIGDCCSDIQALGCNPSSE